MSCSVVISDYIYRCNERPLSNQHRFSEWSSACLGELNFDEFHLTASTVHHPDAVTLAVIKKMSTQLFERNQLSSRHKPDKIGFIYGTTTLNLQIYMEKLQHFLHPQELFDHRMGFGWFLAGLRQQLPMRGYQNIITNSCASGALAIIQGMELVQSGALTACIVGGFDLLTFATVKGFESLQILSTRPMVPLSGESQGINLADGGGLLLIEREDLAQQCQSRLLGYGSTSDAFHMTQPFPEGVYMLKAMQMALTRAGKQVAEIDYVNAHGTGTEANDQAESMALKQLAVDWDKVESTKRLTGHTLAGAGALEYCLSLEKAKKIRQPNQSFTFLSNSFGFGGTNVSLLGCAYE